VTLIYVKNFTKSIAHALHRICEFIREKFSDIDKLISTCKKIFLKSPQRVALYKEMCPDLSLPPQPVITRWGTWLQTSLFYSANIERIKNVVINLKNDAASIVECKNILQKPKLTEELLYIETHFKFLPDTIKYFENQNLPLSEAITKLNSTLTNLKSIDDHFGAQLTTKITSIFSKNPDFQIWQQFVSQDLQNNVGPQYKQFVQYFNHPPLSSVDVERTFSLFRDLLTPKRTKLGPENLKTLLLIYTNNSVFLEGAR
jgi:hypothetical protein